MSWFETRLLGKEDALAHNHEIMCQTLGIFLHISEERAKILHGINTVYYEDDACLFAHGTNNCLSADSVCIVSTTLFDDVQLSTNELYYYLLIAYKRFLNGENLQSEKDEFAAGLDYFRNACKIECDENGDPILEGYPHA